MMDWEALPDSRYQQVAVASFLPLAIIVFTSISVAIWYFFQSDYTMASTVVAFASGASTVLLVGLTGWYTILTRELVSQAEKDREQQRELRRRDRTEEWYGDLLFHLRRIQQIWNRAFADPSGMTEDDRLYVRADSNQQLWQDLGSHFEHISRIVCGRPLYVDEDIAEDADDIYVKWVLMTDIDLGGEPEDPRVFQSDEPFKSVEALEEQIVEVSGRD